MARKRTNPDFLNGVPELLVLSLLTEQAMHGYELVQRIKIASGKTLEFGEGCIYPILHRLEADGLLISREDVVRGRSRVVYQTTPGGAARLKESTATWRRIVQGIDLALQGGNHVATEQAG